MDEMTDIYVKTLDLEYLRVIHVVTSYSLSILFKYVDSIGQLCILIKKYKHLSA